MCPTNCKLSLKERKKYQAAVTMGMVQCFETKSRPISWRKILTAALHDFLGRPTPEEYIFVFKSIAPNGDCLSEGELPPSRHFVLTGGWELLWASILSAYIQWQTNGPMEFYINHFRSIVLQVLIEDPELAPLAKVQAAQDLVANTTVLEDTGLNKAEQYLEIVAEMKARGKETTMPQIMKLLKQVQYSSQKDSWANQRTLQEIKGLAHTFVVHPNVLAALRQGELQHGPHYYTSSVWKLGAIRECILDRDPEFLVKWIRHVHTMLVRGDCSSLEHWSVNPILRGTRDKDGNIECGLVVLVSIKLGLVDLVFSQFELAPVVAEHMSTFDKFNACYPAVAQIASVARTGGQLLPDTEWVRALSRPLDRASVDALKKVYSGGVVCLS